MPTEYLTRTTKVIIAEVIAVIPEFYQVIVSTLGSWQYTITRKTAGPAWNTLKEGDIVELVVYTELPIVKEVLSVNKS